MDSLLKLALEAHGGSKAWNKLQSLQANVSIGGALWDQKQLPGLFKNTRVELKLQWSDRIGDVTQRYTGPELARNVLPRPFEARRPITHGFSMFEYFDLTGERPQPGFRSLPAERLPDPS